MNFKEFLNNSSGSVNEALGLFGHTKTVADAMKEIKSDGEWDNKDLKHVEKVCTDIYFIIKKLNEIDEGLGVIFHTLDNMEKDKYLDAYASGTDFDIKTVYNDIAKIDDALEKIVNKKIKDIAKRLYILK